MNTLTARDILLSTAAENQNRADGAWKVLVQSQLWCASPHLRPTRSQLDAAWLLYDQMAVQGFLPAAWEEDVYLRLRHPLVYPPVLEQRTHPADAA